jgi:hypothetical protein
MAFAPHRIADPLPFMEPSLFAASAETAEETTARKITGSV